MVDPVVRGDGQCGRAFGDLASRTGADGRFECSIPIAADATLSSLLIGSGLATTKPSAPSGDDIEITLERVAPVEVRVVDDVTGARSPTREWIWSWSASGTTRCSSGLWGVRFGNPSERHRRVLRPQRVACCGVSGAPSRTIVRAMRLGMHLHPRLWRSLADPSRFVSVSATPSKEWSRCWRSIVAGALVSCERDLAW